LIVATYVGRYFILFSWQVLCFTVNLNKNKKKEKKEEKKVLVLKSAATNFFNLSTNEET
jgi:hypothetical protein